MWTLLMLLTLAADVPPEGGPTIPRAEQTPPVELGPLGASPAPGAHPLSLGLFTPRPSTAPRWDDPLDGPTPRAEHDPARDPIDLSRWFAPKEPDPWGLGPRPKPEIDPYDFSAPPPVIEVRTSTWVDPWRQRELTESLWELREANGVNLRIGVGRSDCWWR